MEGLTLVKVSDLETLLQEIRSVKEEIRSLRESEESLKAYSIQEAADLLHLHYNSVRKLILSKKLFAKYLDGEKGKCVIPAASLKEYILSSKQQSSK